MILGDSVTIGGGGASASIFASGALTSADSCYATKGGRTYNGVWSTIQTPNPAWRGLPSGYTQLECITSSGTQAIDTGITYRVGVNIETSYIGSGGYVFSANYSLGYIYRFNFTTTGSYIYGKNWVDISTTVSSGLNTVKTNNAIITVNGTSYTHSQTNSGSGGSLTLFCYRDENENYQGFSSISMYETIITNGSTIIADYIPCINPSNEVGFYDTVSETFKGRNVGSGNFTAGEVVPQYLTTQGFLISNLKEYGTYTVTATHSGLTKSVDVLVDSAERFNVEFTFSSNTTYLYYLGDECTDVTGGWSIDGWSSGVSGYSLIAATKNTDNFYASAPAARCTLLATNNMIDLSQYNFVAIQLLDTTATGGIVGGESTKSWTAQSQIFSSGTPPYSKNVKSLVARSFISTVSDSRYVYMGNWWNNTTTFYMLALCKNDDISGLSAYGSTIASIISNSASLLADGSAVNYMLSCTGDFMWSALSNATFVSNMRSSAYYQTILANGHWAKAISVL